METRIAVFGGKESNEFMESDESVEFGSLGSSERLWSLKRLCEAFKRMCGPG